VQVTEVFGAAMSVARGTSVRSLTWPCLPAAVDTIVARRPGAESSLRCSNSFHRLCGVALRLPWWPTL